MKHILPGIVGLLLLFTADVHAELSFTRVEPDSDPTAVLSRSTTVPTGNSLIAHLAVYGDDIAELSPDENFLCGMPLVSGNLYSYLCTATGGVGSTTSFTFDVSCQVCEINAQMIDVDGTIVTNSASTFESSPGLFVLESESEETEPYVIGFHVVHGHQPETVQITSSTNTNWATIAQLGDEDGEFNIDTVVQVFDADTNTSGYIDAIIDRDDTDAGAGWLVTIVP